MPQVRAERFIRLDPETAFALSQTTGEFRLKWDPFISEQGFLDGATAAGKGVRTRTVSRMGLKMVSEYVSYMPPKNVGMTMVSGPWFFENFGGGWRFTPDDGGTRAVWKYTFSCRPALLKPVAERIGGWSWAGKLSVGLRRSPGPARILHSWQNSARKAKAYLAPALAPESQSTKPATAPKSRPPSSQPHREAQHQRCQPTAPAWHL